MEQQHLEALANKDKQISAQINEAVVYLFYYLYSIQNF